MLNQEHQILYDDDLRCLAQQAIEQTAKEVDCERDVRAPSVNGLAICKIVGFQESLPLLAYEFGGTKYLHRAIAVVGNVDDIAIGSLVCAAFDRECCDRPMVVGKFACDVGKKLLDKTGTFIVDEEQITLRCGKASISLKADGTVAIRGTNVASRASNTNRIRGGNVQIN